MKRAGFAGAFFCAGGRSAGVSPAGPACVPPPRLPTMLGVLLGGRRGWERSPAGLGRLFTKTARLPTSLVAAAAGRTPGQPARRQRSELRSQAGFAGRTSKRCRRVLSGVNECGVTLVISCKGDLVMKRLISVAIIVASLGAAACTTAVVVRPPRAGLVLVNGIWVVPPRAGAVWIAPHWERRGYQRVWIEGFWRY